MIRRFIPKFIKREIRRILFYKKNRSVIDALRNCIGQKRLILFLVPTHGNIGDQFITFCERQFLKDNLKDCTIIEISDACWEDEKRKIINNIRKEDCLLIHGGGFIGTLWEDIDSKFREIINAFPNNRIVIFPQSVFFSNDTYGRGQINISRQIYTQHKNFFLCVREKNSYECVKTNRLIKDTNQCFLMPDIVTYYKGDFSGYRRSNVALLCLRHDKEKIIDVALEEEIVRILSDAELEISYTDMVVSYRISENMRDKEISKKLQEFAQCKLVITDRLHGMLLAAVTATPCLFMDNCSKKVSGTYEWIQNLQYIKPLRDMDGLRAFIHQLERGQIYHYHNEHLHPYYTKLADIIKNDEIVK